MSDIREICSQCHKEFSPLASARGDEADRCLTCSLQRLSINFGAKDFDSFCNGNYIVMLGFKRVHPCSCRILIGGEFQWNGAINHVESCYWPNITKAKAIKLAFDHVGLLAWDLKQRFGNQPVDDDVITIVHFSVDTE